MLDAHRPPRASLNFMSCCQTRRRTISAQMACSKCIEMLAASVDMTNDNVPHPGTTEIRSALDR
jgi:hypothetical protein